MVNNIRTAEEDATRAAKVIWILFAKLGKSYSFLGFLFTDWDFFSDGTVTRGCIVELTNAEHTYCMQDKSSNVCLDDNCNDDQLGEAPTKVDEKNLLQCMYSDGFDDGAAIFKVCPKPEDKCFIHVFNDVVRRGCLSDFVYGVDLVADCENSKICEKCSEQRCNSRKIENQHCIECSSSNDPGCKENPLLGMSRKCPKVLTPRGCYHKEEDNLVERGCVAHLTEETHRKCEKGDSQCKTCEGESCNSKLSLPKCYECNSAVDGEKCKTIPSIAIERECPNYMDECYVHINGDVVNRNCTGDTVVPTPKVCSSEPKHCLLSTGANDKIIEANRCISCDSLDDESCNSPMMLQHAKSCPLNIEKEGCYHFVNNITKQHARGIYAIILLSTNISNTILQLNTFFISVYIKR